MNTKSHHISDADALVAQIGSRLLPASERARLTDDVASDIDSAMVRRIRADLSSVCSCLRCRDHGTEGLLLRPRLAAVVSEWATVSDEHDRVRIEYRIRQLLACPLRTHDAGILRRAQSVATQSGVGAERALPPVGRYDSDGIWESLIVADAHGREHIIDRAPVSDAVLDREAVVKTILVQACPCAYHLVLAARSEDDRAAEPAHLRRIGEHLVGLQDSYGCDIAEVQWKRLYVALTQAIGHRSRQRAKGTAFGEKPDRKIRNTQQYTELDVQIAAELIKGAVARNRSSIQRYLATGVGSLDAAEYLRAVAHANPGRPSAHTIAARRRIIAMPPSELTDLIATVLDRLHSHFPDECASLRDYCEHALTTTLSIRTDDGAGRDIGIADHRYRPDHLIDTVVADDPEVDLDTDPNHVHVLRALLAGARHGDPAASAWVAAAATNPRDTSHDHTLANSLMRNRSTTPSELRAIPADAIATLLNDVRLAIFASLDYPAVRDMLTRTGERATTRPTS